LPRVTEKNSRRCTAAVCQTHPGASGKEKDSLREARNHCGEAGACFDPYAEFRFVNGHFTGVPKLKGALQTALVGSLAAGVAYLIAKFIA
jgi:hypothetical protein